MIKSAKLHDMAGDEIPLFGRFRSKSFRDDEIRVLIKLVAKYKAVVLNKSITNTAIRTKEITWEKIANEFNSQSKDVEREASVLKRKWENLKKTTRGVNLENGALDFDQNKNDTTKMVLALKAVENGGPILDAADMDLFYEKEPKPDKSSLIIDDTEDWTCKDKSSDDECQDEVIKKRKTKKPLRVYPGQSMTPFECKLLLNAVKQEKDVVFSSKSIGLKQRAWKKITAVFNKQSPRRRTANELSKCFLAMKNVTKKVNMTHMYEKREKEKYEKLNNSGHDQNIKMEIISDSSDDDEGDEKNVFESEIRNGFISTNNDPLGVNATNSDSGLGFTDSGSNKEMNNLKLELLNYEMETARMQRKRLEHAIEAEKYEREMRAIEISLKMRAARLEVISAEAKFDPASPALAYTAQEARCRTYMQEFLT